MTYRAFVKKYLGKETDFDHTSGVQCVDLAKLYIDKVIGVTPQAIGNAHCYYDDFYKTYLDKYFHRIPYQKGSMPQKGDLVVWGVGYNGKSKYGHIAIATGISTATALLTYDQNFGAKKMQEVTHNYKGVLGFLRPIDQRNIVSPPKVKNGTYTLTAVRGVYKGYGAESGRKHYKDLTENAKRHAVHKENDADAYLKRGTQVTVKETKLLTSGNLWAKIPSGYLCIWEHENSKLFLKR